MTHTRSSPFHSLLGVPSDFPLYLLSLRSFHCGFSLSLLSISSIALFSLIALSSSFSLLFFLPSVCVVEKRVVKAEYMAISSSVKAQNKTQPVTRATAAAAAAAPAVRRRECLGINVKLQLV